MLPIAAELGWPAGIQGVVQVGRWSCSATRAGGGESMRGGERMQACRLTCRQRVPDVPSFPPCPLQSAFLWGYMATQLLGGTLADKYGGEFSPLHSAMLHLAALLSAERCPAPCRRRRRPSLSPLWTLCGHSTTLLLPAGKLVMGLGVVWFSLASALLPAAAITPWTAAAGLTLPAVLAARFLVGFGEGEELRADQLASPASVPCLQLHNPGSCRGLTPCVPGLLRLVQAWRSPP